MENQHFMFFTLLFAMTIRCHGLFKATQLQLYMHETLSGPSPTNIQVASAQSTASSPTFFGLIAMIDNPLRDGPNPDSTIMGRAQGLVALDSKDEFSIHMTFDLVFTTGYYNGSTLSIAGQNPYMRPYRELAIVGGSGAFRLASGYVGVTTVTMNNTVGDSVFGYNITIFRNFF